MTSTRFTAVASGLGLVATWLVNAYQVPATSATVSARTVVSPATRDETPLPVVEVHTDHLRADARPRARFVAPRRNPFVFSTPVRPGAPAPVVASALPVQAEIVAPPPPPYTLSGIAEDAGPDGPVRTAIVAGLRDVFLVHEGDTVDGRYTVARIAADGVELVPVGPGARLVLRLK